jgi:hypothetical protein
MRSTWLEGLVGGKGEGAALDSDVWRFSCVSRCRSALVHGLDIHGITPSVLCVRSLLGRTR